MGKTCEPKAFSFQCMTKFTTNKIKKKKKKKIMLTMSVRSLHLCSSGTINIRMSLNIIMRSLKKEA